MNQELQQTFITRWNQYFAGAELPIGYYYTDQVSEADREDSRADERCLIGNLNRVREGHTFVYAANTPGCPGGKRYTGFTQKLRPNFEYFLSCGIPGQMEGERYKKTPELVQEHLKHHPPFEAPGQYLVFKRWDRFGAEEEPLAVVFFAPPDVLSGLFTLANFDTSHPDGVIAPMGAGCASLIDYPCAETRSDHPRCVLGMFDVSARPSVPAGVLTFAVPMARFVEMVGNMDESFLITGSWQQVKDRLP